MIYQVTYEGRDTKQKHKVSHLVPNREALLALRNSKENVASLEVVRQGDDSAKGSLLQLAYNLGYANQQLAGCKSIGSFFFHDVDCYESAELSAECRGQSAELTSSAECRGQRAELAAPDECSRYKEQILSKKDEIGLMMLERSARGGWHLVCRRERGKTILENQVRVATILQMEMDTNAHDLQRVVFSTSGSEDDLVYLDDALFEEPMTREECEAEYAALKERERKGQEQVPPGAKKANKHYRPWEDKGQARKTVRAAVAPSEGSVPAGEDSGTAIPSAVVIEPASARTRFIVNECLKESGLVVSDLNTKGGIHNSVKCLLSVGTTQLLTQGELLGVLSELMPDYWNDDNIRQLVADFYEKYTDDSQKMTLFQRRVFAQSMRMRRSAAAEEGLDDDQQGSATPLSPLTAATTLSAIYSAPYPPQLPVTLPRLVRLVTSKTPVKMKPTVAQGMFPPLGAYPKDLQFLYIDNQYRELRMNCLTLAGTGSGKDISLKQPLKHLTAPMRERDAISRQMLKEYNEACNINASNKKKPQRPEGLVIQYVSANLTAARLSQLMDDSQGAFIYTHLHEFEQWYNVEGKTGGSCSFLNLKLADDEDNPFGQERAGVQSVNYSGPLGLNWNASTTPSKIQRMFRHVMVDGPVSRCCLATVCNPGLASAIPVFGSYDEQYDQALKPYIDHLTAATGEVDCKPARKLLTALKAECDDFTRQTQDEVFDNLTHRALVHAFRKACLLYAANGMKWEKAIENFCRWSLHYDLWLKMHYFADMIRQTDGQTLTSRHGPRNLLEQLPDEFTRQQAIAVRQKAGKNVQGTTNMLSQWLHRGYILQLTVDSWKKVPPKQE